MVLPYDMLLSDLLGVFEKIAAFTGIEVNEKLREQVTERSKKQKNYQRKHQVMDLEHFGITKEMINRDFGFVFEEYGINRDRIK